MLLFFSIATKAAALPTILPCFCPAGDPDGRAACLAAEKGGQRVTHQCRSTRVRYLGVIAALVVSPGLAKHPVWTSVELYKVFCAVVASLPRLGRWAGFFRRSQQRWWLAALALSLALLIGLAHSSNLVVDLQTATVAGGWLCRRPGSSRAGSCAGPDNVGVAAGWRGS